MDGSLISVAAAELYPHLGTASARTLVDAFDGDDRTRDFLLK
jgi:hypothetical protein